MFPDPGPRLFALPPGTDFAACLVAGLVERLRGAPPEAMARVTLWLNSQRMARRVRAEFAACGAHLLPRLRLVTDLSQGMVFTGVAPVTPPLRRRLELAQAVRALLDRQPDIAPRTALYDLADSLADLMDEMHGEGVSPATIATLDVSDHSAHWQRTQAFMTLLAPWFADLAEPDAQARQRLVMDRAEALWQVAPPQGPVLVAGSTGSRGTTARLMRAVAALPQGALILPGFDFDLPGRVWDALSDAMTAEDHPQYRFFRLLKAMSMAPSQVRPWVDAAPPNPGRNRLVSLSLRPAPVTDQWLVEGQRLPDLMAATKTMTLIEAPDPRTEAATIALILRDAAQTGKRAALVSPDRDLTRRVTAALDRWTIRPDDSAGLPLALSPPGRFLRQIAGLFGERLTATTLLALLKHPLTASGAGRGTHLLLTRALELSIRRNGPVFPVGTDLLVWAKLRPDAEVWGRWIANALDGLEALGQRPLAEHVTQHMALAGILAAGPEGVGTGGLWDAAAGVAALATMYDLQREAGSGGIFGCADYNALVRSLLSRGEIRDAVVAHPDIVILGPREVREHDSDLLILGGMNDGSWPQLPPPDPWMNRQMRLQAGLLLPERRIGLSAHDYQQAISAPKVVLTRSLRSADAETVPSRWLNRLTNLMGGLPMQGGPTALAEMRGRGADWLALAARAAAPPARLSPAHRPAPRPPLSARPGRLAVTGISTLIRDPYAIYARHVLRLYPLNPLQAEPDARLRGSVLHKILEAFARTRVDLPGDARLRLMDIAATMLATEVPWPAARALWLARLERAADHILSVDADLGGLPVVIEEKGETSLAGLDFHLTARPDRIDLLADGRVHLFDYKTGSPPTPKQQAHFDKQLLLEAAMTMRGAFGSLGGPREVAGITYIGLGPGLKRMTSAPNGEELDAVWAGLERLVASYAQHAQGYASRRAMHGSRFAGDYDHLARFGEWEMTDTPLPEDVG